MNNTLWELTVFSTRGITTPEEFQNAFENGHKKTFNTVKECFEYIGCKIPRQRIGYSGTDGLYEYSLVRVM